MMRSLKLKKMANKNYMYFRAFQHIDTCIQCRMNIRKNTDEYLLLNNYLLKL